MVRRSIKERFCIWWWPEEGEDFIQDLARCLGWPVQIETENDEDWKGGRA